MPQLEQSGWHVVYLIANKHGEQTQKGPITLHLLRDLYHKGEFKYSGEGFMVNNENPVVTGGQWKLPTDIAGFYEFLKSQECPVCNTSMTPGSRFCSGCGNDYFAEPPIQTEVEPITEEEASPDNTADAIEMTSTADPKKVLKPSKVQSKAEEKGEKTEKPVSPYDSIAIKDIPDEDLEKFQLCAYAKRWFYCYATGGLFGNFKISADAAAAFQEEDARKDMPLQNLIPELREPAILLWTHVNAFLVHDPSGPSRQKILEEIYKICVSHDSPLRDEALSIVCKQLTSEEDYKPCEKVAGYLLMDALLSRFGPTLKFRPYLRCWLQEASETKFTDKRIAGFIAHARRSLEFHAMHPATLYNYASVCWDMNHRYGLTRAPIPPALLFFHTQKYIQPLHRFPPKYFEICRKIFEGVNAYLEDGCTLEDVLNVIGSAQQFNDKQKMLLRNEMYCVFLRQANFPEETATTLKCFSAIVKLQATHPPGKLLAKVIMDHFAVQCKLCRSIRADAEGFRKQIAAELECAMAREAKHGGPKPDEENEKVSEMKSGANPGQATDLDKTAQEQDGADEALLAQSAERAAPPSPVVEV